MFNNQIKKRGKKTLGKNTNVSLTVISIVILFSLVFFITENNYPNTITGNLITGNAIGIQPENELILETNVTIPEVPNNDSLVENIIDEIYRTA